MSCCECVAIKEYQGVSSQKDYPFEFEYQNSTEVHVSVYNPAIQDWKELKPNTDWILINPTVVRLVNTTKEKIRIYRCTDLHLMRSVFQPGTSIKARDLNDNFDQLSNAIEEAKCCGSSASDQIKYGYEFWLNRIDRDIDDPVTGVRGDLVKSFSSLTIDDDSVASTKWIDNRYWDQCEETTYSSDRWVDEMDDVHVPTTLAVENRLHEVLMEIEANGDRGIGDAPADGQEYVRKDYAWSVVDVGVTKIIAGSNVGIVSSNGDGTGVVTINAAGGGDGPGGDFPEAPNDGQLYARQSLGWSSILPNKQSDWNVTDSSDAAFIKNKPTLTNGTLTGVLQGVGISVSNANPAQPEVSVKFGVTADAATTVMPFNVSLLPTLP